jgi:hypothetical protein
LLNVHLLAVNAVPYIVLAVTHIYVIYKCLSPDGDQQQKLNKPSSRKGKPSHWSEVAGHPISRDE